MPLFAKGGGDSINIFGHKVPIALLGGVAAVATVLLVIHARNSGQNVASVGTAPANTGVNPVVDTFGTGGFTADPTGQLANIESQLTQLQQNGINSSTSTQSSFVVHSNPFGFEPGQTAEPIFSGPSWKSAIVGYVPLGSIQHPTGAPVQGLSATTDLGTSSFYLPVAGGFISEAAGVNQ